MQLKTVKNMNKKILIIATLAALSVQSYAQGIFNFATFATKVNAPIYLDSISSTVRASGYSATFYYAQGTLNTETASFQDGLTAGHYITTDSDGHIFGGTQTLDTTGAYTIEVRAWDSSKTSYDAAVAAGLYAGKSGLVHVTLVDPMTTPPNLVGLTSFALTASAVPEPSTIALGVMGLSVLLFRRRK